MDSAKSEATRAYVPQLVGRQDALEQLGALLRPPYQSPVAVLIEAPAGIGKTSLLWAALAQAENQGATTLRASPLEAEVSYSYATLRICSTLRWPGWRPRCRARS